MTGRGGGGSERHTVYAEMLGWSAALTISAMWTHSHTGFNTHGRNERNIPCGGTVGHHHSPPIGLHLTRLMTWLHEEGREAQEIVFQKFFLRC